MKCLATYEEARRGRADALPKHRLSKALLFQKMRQFSRKFNPSYTVRYSESAGIPDAARSSCRPRLQGGSDERT